MTDVEKLKLERQKLVAAREKEIAEWDERQKKIEAEYLAQKAAREAAMPHGETKVTVELTFNETMATALYHLAEENGLDLQQYCQERAQTELTKYGRRRLIRDSKWNDARRLPQALTMG